MAPRQNPPKRRSKVADRQTQAKPRKQNAAKTPSRTAPAVSKQPTRRSRRGLGLSAENNGLPEPARKKSGGSEKKSGTADRKRKPPGEAPDPPAQKRQKSRQAPKDIEESIHTGDLSGRDHVHPRSEEDIEEYSDPIENWRQLGDWPTSFRHSEAMSRSGDHSGDLKELRELRRQRRDSRSSTVNTQRSGQQVPQGGALEDTTGPSDVASSQETQKKSKPLVYDTPKFRRTLEDGFGDVRCIFNNYTLRQPEGKKDTGPSPASEEWRTRLVKEDNKALPEDYRFKDDASFREKLDRLERMNKNEVTVIHSLHNLVCPPAEDLADQYTEDPLGDSYCLLADNWNEKWGCKLELLGTKVSPRPDYCVGFSRRAFDDLFDRIDKWDVDEHRLAPTLWMYFPFLTCEAKSYQESIQYAHNQNALSMTLAISGVVDLFRAVRSEGSIDREILGFSVSYNHTGASVYGHYPTLNGAKTAIYRTNICKLEFASCSDRWAAHKVVRRIYEDWAPMHFRRLYEAVMKIPPDAPPRAGSMLRTNIRDSATPTPIMHRLSLSNSANTPEPSRAADSRDAQRSTTDSDAQVPIPSVERGDGPVQSAPAPAQSSDTSGTPRPPVSTTAGGEPQAKKRKLNQVT